MDIRSYWAEHRESCLAILDSNSPQYFIPKDRDDLAAASFCDFA